MSRRFDRYLAALDEANTLPLVAGREHEADDLAAEAVAGQLAATAGVDSSPDAFRSGGQERGA